MADDSSAARRARIAELEAAVAAREADRTAATARRVQLEASVGAQPGPSTPLAARSGRVAELEARLAAKRQAQLANQQRLAELEAAARRPAKPPLSKMRKGFLQKPAPAPPPPPVEEKPSPAPPPVYEEPKGVSRGFLNKKSGRGLFNESPEKQKPAERDARAERAAARAAALAAMDDDARAEALAAMCPHERAEALGSMSEGDRVAMWAAISRELALSAWRSMQAAENAVAWEATSPLERATLLLSMGPDPRSATLATMSGDEAAEVLWAMDEQERHRVMSAEERKAVLLRSSPAGKARMLLGMPVDEARAELVEMPRVVLVGVLGQLEMEEKTALLNMLSPQERAEALKSPEPEPERCPEPDIDAEDWEPSQAELPDGWEKRFDKRSGRAYYIDHGTRTTHWQPPFCAEFAMKRESKAFERVLAHAKKDKDLAARVFKEADRMREHAEHDRSMQPLWREQVEMAIEFWEEAMYALHELEQDWDPDRLERAAELRASCANNLVLAYMQLGTPQFLSCALSCIDEALEVEPEHPKSLYRRAQVLNKMERYSEAEECLEQVLDLEPRNKEVKKTLKRVRAALDQQLEGEMPPLEG